MWACHILVASLIGLSVHQQLTSRDTNIYFPTTPTHNDDVGSEDQPSSTGETILNVLEIDEATNKKLALEKKDPEGNTGDAQETEDVTGPVFEETKDQLISRSARQLTTAVPQNAEQSLVLDDEEKCTRYAWALNECYHECSTILHKAPGNAWSRHIWDMNVCVTPSRLILKNATYNPSIKKIDSQS